MERVLGIDTAGAALAVGLWTARGTVVDVAGEAAFEHSRRLVAAVAEVLERAGCRLADLDLIAVSEGPGSYTGLRLGAAAAKVLGWAAGVPLVGVDALAVLASNAAGESGPVVALLPARRGQVYARAYRLDPAAPSPTPLGPLLEGETAAVLSNLERSTYVCDTAPLFLGEGVRGHDRLLEAAFGGRARVAPPALDVPRGSAVALLGRERARAEGTTAAAAFLPRYVGPDVVRGA